MIEHIQHFHLHWNTHNLRSHPMTFANSGVSLGATRGEKEIHNTNLRIEEDAKITPWRRNVMIDFSASNEYVASHYNHLGYDNNNQRYFDCLGIGNDISSLGTNSGVILQDVWDARNGYFTIDNDTNNGDQTVYPVAPSLDASGFDLVEVSINSSTEIDWMNMQQIEDSYLTKLREVITKSLCPSIPNGSSNEHSNIKHLEFYQPMIRGEDVNMAQRTSPVARLVHIDTDFGAHDVDGIVNLVEKNSIRRLDSAETGNHDSFPRDEIVAAIKSGKRFAVINAWKGILGKNSKVERAPLGLMPARYNGDLGITSRQHQCFPTKQPDPKLSRWYVYPDMTNEEVLLFKQYDRRVDLPSDIWHCSLPITEEDKGCHEMVSRRKSFDIRAFVVFDEIVPAEIDRYSDGRVRPPLTLEESGFFCDEQAEKRNASKK